MDASFFIVSGLVLLFTVGPVLLITFLISSSLKSNQKKAVEFDSAMLARIRMNDPNFDMESFKKSAALCVREVFECFSNVDLERLRVLEAKDLYEIHKIDIETGLISGHLFILDLPENMNFRVNEYYIDGDKEIIRCTASISSREKRVDPNTKEILESNNKGYFLHTINLEFARHIGIKTVIGREFAIKECPNCGAEITINTYGKCTYCDTLVTNGEHSWVLNRISDSFAN